MRLEIVALLLLAATSALAYGPVPLRPPPGAVLLSPGADLQAAVDSRPNGTTFFLRKGLYRLQSIVPKPGDIFLGAKGAELNGATLITQVTQEGNLFKASNLPPDPNAIINGVCLPDFPRCDHPQDLYFDGLPLRAVAKSSRVVPGTFFYDDKKGIVYFADDPAGHVVELSTRAYAFDGSVPGVTVQNLVIVNYACADQRGAINNPAGGAWQITNNELRWNHGYGLVAGTGAVVSGNFIHHNGQIGMGGGSGQHDMLVQTNEIAFNVWNGTDCGWECGGAKWGDVSALTVTGNYVHNNAGDGLWTDIDCTEITYDGNTIENNLYAGISHEISGSAVISNNILRYNGSTTFVWGWQGQIQIQNSSDTEVFGNTLVLKPKVGGNGIMIIQQNRGAGYLPQGNWIHDNDITINRGEGAVAGWFADYKPASFSPTNLYDYNHYHVLPASDSLAVWAPNDWLTFSAWQATGQDLHSTRDRGAARPLR